MDSVNDRLDSEQNMMENMNGEIQPERVSEEYDEEEEEWEEEQEEEGEEEKKDKLDMTLFLSMLINQTEIKVVFVEGKWCEVDCNNDVETYENILKFNEKWSHDWR